MKKRLAYFMLKLNVKYNIKHIQIYFPTNGHHKEEMEDLYEYIDGILKKKRTHYTISMEGFNSKVCRQQKILEMFLESD